MSEEKEKRQRPNQVVFYASKENLETLQRLEGNRSDFINRAIELYEEYVRGGKYFTLERTYELLKYQPSEEAQRVNRALRDILWRRDDLPTSVFAALQLTDGTTSTECFSDAKKAMMLAHENPNCVGFHIYDCNNRLVADATRTETNAFAYRHLSPEAMP